MCYAKMRCVFDDTTNRSICMLKITEYKVNLIINLLYNLSDLQGLWKSLYVQYQQDNHRKNLSTDLRFKHLNLIQFQLRLFCGFYF